MAITSDAQLELLSAYLERASDNTWIAVLGAILAIIVFGLYILSRVYFIIEVQRKTTSQFMAFTDDVLDRIWKTSSKRAATLMPNFLNPACTDCAHPMDSYNGTLSIALLYGTRNRIKQRWHENGFLKLAKDPEKFKHEVNILGARLRGKNQHEMELNANGLKHFMCTTRDERFSESNSIKGLTSIMEEGMLLKKQERIDIIKVLFFRGFH